MRSMEENAVRHADNGLALAALSHDLRTPVTSMIALTQLALEAQRQGQGVEGVALHERGGLPVEVVPQNGIPQMGKMDP